MVSVMEVHFSPDVETPLAQVAASHGKLVDHEEVVSRIDRLFNS